MRVFAAVDIPDSIRRDLGRLQEEFRRAAGTGARGVSWVRPSGIHLTLKFLGEISEARLAIAIAALSSIRQFPPFPLEVSGCGFFPDARRPRVLWAGVSAPADLTGLARQVDAALTAHGFAPEDRALQPHLTLARFRVVNSQPALALAAREAKMTGRFEVSEFGLFESLLAPGSPAHYRKMASFPPAG